MARLADGRIGFAGGVAVGDRIAVETVDNRKGWVRAEKWVLLDPGPGRIEPPCPWYRECGGCDWMHLAAPAQLEGKAAIVVDAFKRIGGVPVEAPRVLVGSSALRYRRRLRLHVDGHGRIGLLARASHRVVEIRDCLVARPELMTELERLREWGTSRQKLLVEFDAVELRVSDKVPQMGLFWHTRAGPVSEAALAEVHSLATASRAVGVSGQSSFACQTWQDTAPVEVDVPLGSFVQVNAEVNSMMADALVALCQRYGVATFLELYCGAGNLTLPLLATGLRGRAVEVDGAAVRAARRAAERQGLPGETFCCRDAGSVLREGEGAGDLVLLDPPRTGAAPALHHVSRQRPKYVALCACDPATLARDVRSLMALGYHLEHLGGFDMFPQTHHVEVLAWLSLCHKPA